jgi:hypothetical protein
MTVEPLKMMMMMMMILLATFMAAVTNFTPIVGERIKSAIIFLHRTLYEILLKSLTGFVRLYHGCEISSSHGGEYDFQSCLLAYSSLMMEAVRTSETSVDNHFTRQYNPEDSCEHISWMSKL